MAELTIKSASFENRKQIPRKYSCDGEEINPPLSIEGIPLGTKTLALVIDDPDAPRGTFDHWIVWNITPTNQIGEGSIPGTEGTNSAGQRSYVGMCPPSGTHRYFFRVYALDTSLDLKSSAHKKDLEKAMLGHTLAKGELVGLYSR